MEESVVRPHLVRVVAVASLGLASEASVILGRRHTPCRLIAFPRRGGPSTGSSQLSSTTRARLRTPQPSPLRRRALFPARA